MFNSLSGIITGKFPQKLYLDTHGIEWDVTCPDSALENLPDVGCEGRVYVWMQHTDNLMNLYGFASDRDRSLFFDLLKVDGIGPKGAVKIMNNISTDQMVAILENGDLGLLEKVPGVGKKTAAKMLLQLKGKLTLESNSSTGTKKPLLLMQMSFRLLWTWAMTSLRLLILLKKLSVSFLLTKLLQRQDRVRKKTLFSAVQS